MHVNMMEGAHDLIFNARRSLIVRQMAGHDGGPVCILAVKRHKHGNENA